MSLMRTGLLLWLLSMSGMVPPAAAQESQSGARETEVSIRTLPDSEVVLLGKRFPGSGITGQLQGEMLARLFPSDTFYEGHNSRTLPPSSDLLVASGDQLLALPKGFDHLLIVRGLTVTDSNVIDLAEAFVCVAVGEGLVMGRSGYRGHLARLGRISRIDTTAHITFLNGHRHALKKETGSLGEYYDLMLEVRVGKQDEEWWFNVWQGQFSYALREGPGGYIGNYMFVLNESAPVRE
jgi:hypothetical protein